MNCIAIDDEPLALNIIEDFTGKINFINLIARCTSAIEAVKILQNNDIDLIFLDIQMPHITGLEFVKTLEKPPMIIFTTAYSDYALNGFEVNAIDYLIKPISFERFFKAVYKAYDLYNLKKRNQENYTALIPDSVQSNYLLVKVEYSTIKIDLENILFIEGVKDYVKIRIPEKSLITKSTMKNIEDHLPRKLFVRVHKSFIVAISKIEAIENNRIIIHEKRIPIGSQYKQNFMDILNKFRIN